MSEADQSTSEVRRRVLLKSGVPRALLDAAAASGSPFRLLSWGEPDIQRVSELEHLAPGLAGMCPMAEEFVRYYYEGGRLGNAAIEILGTGYEQFAATILLQFEEAGLRAGPDLGATYLSMQLHTTSYCSSPLARSRS